MLLAHLSDLHVTHPDAAIAAFADGAAALAEAVDHLNRLDRPVDVVVITGDLVDGGTAEEYERLRGLLDGLQAPCYLLPGNHDDPAVMARVFPDHPYLRGERPVRWVADDHEVRFVAVDTTQSDRHDGIIDQAQLDWLEGVLDGDSRPTVLCLHHPPFTTGMWWMEYRGLVGADRLRTIVEARPHVVALLSGHVHRPFHTTWGPTIVASAPSLTYASSLALAADSRPLVTDAPAPIPLYQWDGRDLLAFHTDFRGNPHTLDLRDVIPDWDAYEAGCRAGHLPKDH